ncbi:LysE family translocator [Aquimarina agarilytica]|uniref:LysE family translocator n=1 Tax=Aquimarina agarilytica TaxID=1087449 RepID=UPI0018DEDF4A|nr:LysE family translocator [Aquimarina agarilytica]
MAGILLNITPGADTIYILTRSITQGKKAGIYSVLGIASGAVFHILFAAFGLSMLLMKSVMLFTLVKWCGAGYLIYLGLKMLWDKSKLTVDQNTSDKELYDLLIIISYKYAELFFVSLRQKNQA